MNVLFLTTLPTLKACKPPPPPPPPLHAILFQTGFCFPFLGSYSFISHQETNAILFSKDQVDNSGKTLVRQNEITSEAEVDLLGLKIDQRLSFDSHISKICRKASKQLNALERSGGFLSIPSSFKLRLLSSHMAFL